MNDSPRLILSRNYHDENHFKYEIPFLFLIAMRVMLFIPVLILFLSNVPFVQQIPMEQAIAMMQGDESCGEHQECSRGTENLDASCSMEEPACERSCGSESTSPDATQGSCCQQAGATCVCIVCFQYAAPVHSLTEYLFYSSSPAKSLQAYLIAHVKDQHIGAPWQPPDMV